MPPAAPRRPPRPGSEAEFPTVAEILRHTPQASPHRNMPTLGSPPASYRSSTPPIPPPPIPRDQPDPYIIGSTYPSIKDACDTLLQYTVARGLSYHIQAREKKRFRAVCRDKRCPFRLRFSLTKDGHVKTTVSIPHRCSPSTHSHWKSASSVRYLQPTYQKLYNNDSSLQPKALRAAELAQGNNVTYMQAWRTLKAAHKAAYENDVRSFQKLPAYLRRMADADRSGYYRLETSAGAFNRLFLAPGPTVDAFQHCQPFIAVDATPWKNRWELVLMVAATFDSNNQILPLAYGVAGEQSKENWLFFFKYLKEAFPGIDDPSVTIMSDSSTGLESAIPEVLPKSCHCHCPQQIQSSLRDRKVSQRVQELFTKAIQTPHGEECGQLLRHIRNIDASSADYIASIPATTWARHAVPNPRFGHTTSKVLESLSSTWMYDLRERPLLEALKQIYMDLSQQFYKCRTQEMMHSIEFTDYAQQILNREAGLARFYQVVISSDSLFQVSREGRSRQVDLDRSTCSCTDFQEYQLPCRHAIAAIHAVGRQISSFVHPRYLQESYRSTYKAVFMPVNDDFLADDPDCGPCYLRREKGSNGKARRIHGHRLFTRQSKCSACGQDGHYRSSKDCPLKGSNPTAVETSERPGKAWMHTPSGFTEEAIPGSEETSENEDLVQLEKDLEKAAAENCKET